MPAFLRPKHVWWAIAAYVAGFLIWHLWAEPSAELNRRMFRANSFGGLCWYSLGTVLAWQIYRTHAAGSTMRRAWGLMAGSAAAVVFRHLIQFYGWYVGGWELPQLQWVSGLGQAPLAHSLLFLMLALIAVSLLLLIASLLTMWSAFRKVGLGVRFGAVDTALVLAGLALIPIILTNYPNLDDANALMVIVRLLQYSIPFLIVVSATLGIILYRISEGMGGGELSKCLRALTAFLLLRLVGYLLITFPWGEWTPAAALLRRIVWASIDGVFVLALAYRWHIARLADEAVVRAGEEAAPTIPRA